MPTVASRRRLLAVIAVVAVFALVPFNPFRLLSQAGDRTAAQEPALTHTATDAPSPSLVPTAVPSLVPAVAVASPTPDPTPAGPPAPESLTGYRWPLAQIRITQPFGPTRSSSWSLDGQPYHDGLDLATFCGDHIRAAHAGTVLAAGRHYDDYLGWLGDLQPYYDRLDAKKLRSTLPIVVVIDDGNGYRSIYAHFSRIVVARGDLVEAGTFLGYEGMSGNASGCHLHYGLFSPEETATLTFNSKLAAKMLLPDREILRVDPQRVLPPAPSPAS